MASSVYILKIVEKNSFLRLQMRAKECLIIANFLFTYKQYVKIKLMQNETKLLEYLFAEDEILEYMYINKKQEVKTFKKTEICQYRIFDRSSSLLRLKYSVFQARGLFIHGDYILHHIEYEYVNSLSDSLINFTLMMLKRKL